jgi:succinylglutamate desuccinylase
MSRIIGQYTGKTHGALVLIFGAIHGNETAGPAAIQEVFRMLEHEPLVNPGFEFRGKIMGIMGNLQAYNAGQRFLQHDLNRIWTKENVERIRQSQIDQLEAEDREIAEIDALMQAEIQAYQPEALVLLDLHTTSAGGGIFCIPTDQQSSLRLAKTLHVPVILGLLEEIEGAFLQFAIGNQLVARAHPLPTVGVAFESGQHEDPSSISRAISAVISCLRASGCIHSEDVDNRHERMLLRYSQTLPKVTRIKHVHHIKPGDQFKMRPGYHNFQAIHTHEHLADDITGPVYAPLNGLILMPLYQAKGSDGFFIVETLDPDQ